MKKNKHPLKALSFDMSEPSLEFLSNREVTIEGSKGVLEYSDTLIRISLKMMTVSFVGRGLNLKCISESALIISGFISEVKFTV